MEITKRQGELIGRATGVLFALWLGYAALTCFRWAEAARTDPVAQEMRRTAVRTRGRPGGPPFVIFYLLSAGLGTLGVGLAAVSIAPGITVSILEQVRGNPGEPRDDADWRLPL